jgi:hypothetical protein
MQKGETHVRTLIKEKHMQKGTKQIRSLDKEQSKRYTCRNVGSSEESWIRSSQRETHAEM